MAGLTSVSFVPFVSFVFFVFHEPMEQPGCL